MDRAHAHISHCFFIERTLGPSLFRASFQISGVIGKNMEGTSTTVTPDDSGVIPSTGPALEGPISSGTTRTLGLSLTEKELDTIAELMFKKFKEKGSPSGSAGEEGAHGHSDELPVRVLPPVPKSVSLSEVLGAKELPKEKEAPKKDKEDVVKGEKDMVFLCDGLPPIKQKLVSAIEKGEFVELAELLPKNPSWDEDSVEVSDNVIVIAKHRPTKKKVIKDIESWVEAYCTFAAIRCRKCPSLLMEMLAYEATIVKAARDYGGQGWLSYDYRFRQTAAAKALTTGWGQKDMALWNDIFLKPRTAQEGGSHRSSERASYTQGERAKRGLSSGFIPGVTKKPKKPGEKAGWKAMVCYPYSYTGKCTRDKCEYLHLCYDCGEPHSRTECTKKAVATG